MRWLILGLVAACAGSTRLDTKEGTKTALIAAASDEAAMLQLLGTPVVHGGLWFDDAACKALPVGDIPADKRQAFARCLVGLKLQASPREHAVGDVVVMTYAPGFEVEMRLAGSQLQWIGASAKRSTDTLPAISGDALEALRVAGDRDGPLDDTARSTIEGELTTTAVSPNGPSKEEKDYAFTWTKVCLDSTGAVLTADSYLTTSSEADKVFLAAARTWKFRPFTVRDQPIAVCAMARMVYPPKSAPVPEILPMPPPPSRGKKRTLMLATPTLLATKRISGTTNISPNDVSKSNMAQAGIPHVEGTFRMCLDEAGAVELVVPIKPTGIAEYDERIMTTMKTWRYSPFLVDEQPVPVCSVISFKYSQKR